MRDFMKVLYHCPLAQNSNALKKRNGRRSQLQSMCSVRVTEDEIERRRRGIEKPSSIAQHETNEASSLSRVVNIRSERLERDTGSILDIRSSLVERVLDGLAEAVRRRRPDQLCRRRV